MLQGTHLPPPSPSHLSGLSQCTGFECPVGFLFVCFCGKLYYFFFFKNKFIHFNWKLNTLQYCGGFAIHCHESATSNLDWSSILHMVIYMFQCYSLKSSHPHLLPQSPKVCSLHLGLFCCLAYRVIILIFVNSIFMC